jgi:hypothetical protein
MLDIQSLVVLGEQGGSYSMTYDWVVERVKNLSSSYNVMRRF